MKEEIYTIINKKTGMYLPGMDDNNNVNYFMGFHSEEDAKTALDYQCETYSLDKDNYAVVKKE